MPESHDKRLVDFLRGAMKPLADSSPEYDTLLAAIGDAHLVLLGETSHGTYEFYTHRAEITKRLIQQRGFLAVAVEADWPDAHRVNSYVRGRSTDQNAEQALSGFRRLPAWMRCNEVVRDFTEWLRSLDLNSLNRPRVEVVQYLEGIDPAAGRRARQRYSCFHHLGEDKQIYELFHLASNPAFLLHFSVGALLSNRLRSERLEWAVGVVYRPETERISHYFYAVLPDQFDALIHLDRTRALQPLDRHIEAHLEEVPETFLSGI